MDRRWLAVKDARTKPVPEIAGANTCHAWLRRHIAYRAEAVDQWALPDQTRARGYGDCEDIAILGRALMIAAGYPSRHLWVVLVKDLIAHVDHAVLVMDRADPRGWMLDHRAPSLLAMVNERDYAPIIGFCDDRAVTFGRRR